MRNTFFLGLVTVSAILVVVFHVQTAKKARKKSDEILSKFNEINEQIKRTNDSFNNNSSSRTLESNYNVASMNSEIVLLIDSIKNWYDTTTATVTTPQKSMYPTLYRLLGSIQKVNKYKLDRAGSPIADTIKYWMSNDAFDSQKWFSTFFIGTPKLQTITYLNYLKTEAIANSY